ncbi:MAG: hypothetical protein R2748_12485 [Bryobacterales bacterium]
MQEQIEDADAQLAKLKQQANEAGRDMQQSWKDSVDELQRKTDQLKSEWEQLEGKSDDAWDDFSRRAENAMTEIKAGIQKAADDLKG